MNTGRISKQILSATRTKISHMYSGEREKENKETNRPPGIILDRKKKSRRDFLAQIGQINTCRISLQIPLGEQPLGLKKRWEDDIKFNLIEICCEDVNRIHVTQYCVH